MKDTFKDWLVSRNIKGSENVDRPLVTLSYAQSLDGSLGLVRGQPAMISSKESMVLTHQTRALHDSILVGVGTVQADNPRLTVRHVKGKNPLPVILDTNLRIPVDCNLFRQKNRPVWIFSSLEQDPKKVNLLGNTNARVFPTACTHDRQLDLAQVLNTLFREGIASVMIEGGARVITSFLQSGLIDRAVITIAPCWLGGYNALTDKLFAAADDLSDGLLFPRIISPRYELLGDDIVIWGDVRQTI